MYINAISTGAPVVELDTTPSFTGPVSAVRDWQLALVDTSSGPVTSWYWEVSHPTAGVVATSTDQNPTFDLQEFGPEEFDVQLQVNGDAMESATDSFVVRADGLWLAPLVHDAGAEKVSIPITIATDENGTALASPDTFQLVIKDEDGNTVQSLTGTWDDDPATDWTTTGLMWFAGGTAVQGGTIAFATELQSEYEVTITTTGTFPTSHTRSIIVIPTVNVTSGADSGAGTLREVMTGLSGNVDPLIVRVLVDVINVTSEINSIAPNVTLVGNPTTLHADLTTEIGSAAGLAIKDCSNFAVRNMRFYVTGHNAGANERAVKFTNVTNLTVENCVAAFANDQCIAIGDCFNVVVRRCICAWDVSDPGGFIIENDGDFDGDVAQGTSEVYNNLFAHTYGRPSITHHLSKFHRNMGYNYSSTAGMLQLKGPWKDSWSDVEDNFLQAGPDTTPLSCGITPDACVPMISNIDFQGGEYYANGNLIRTVAGTEYTIWNGRADGSRWSKSNSPWLIESLSRLVGAPADPVLGVQVNTWVDAQAWANNALLGTTNHDCIEDRIIDDFLTHTGAVTLIGHDDPLIDYDPATQTCIP